MFIHDMEGGGQLGQPVTLAGMAITGIRDAITASTSSDATRNWPDPEITLHSLTALGNSEGSQTQKGGELFIVLYHDRKKKCISS